MKVTVRFGAREVERGDGWRVTVAGDVATLRFGRRCDDPRTLARLRLAGARYCPIDGWRLPARRLDDLLTIAHAAETWESVGEDPPSQYDDEDYTIFHE